MSYLITMSWPRLLNRWAWVGGGATGFFFAQQVGEGGPGRRRDKPNRRVPGLPSEHMRDLWEKLQKEKYAQRFELSKLIYIGSGHSEGVDWPF